MKRLTELLHSRRANLYSGVCLGLLWMLFAYAHLLKFLETWEWPLMIFCVAETLTVAFFIFRKKPTTISIEPFDWVIAIVGTFAPLFFRPSLWGIFPLAKYAILVGAFFQMISVISLNRSFALVAAKREIKTAKMYRIVRHPIYASYCFIFTGYLLTNTNIYNAVIYVISIACLGLRVFREEIHLAADPFYRDYMLKVRFRLFPFVF